MQTKVPETVVEQLAHFHNESERFNLRFTVGETAIGRKFYLVIKLENTNNFFEKNIETQKIINGDEYEINNDSEHN